MNLSSKHKALFALFLSSASALAQAGVVVPPGPPLPPPCPPQDAPPEPDSFWVGGPTDPYVTYVYRTNVYNVYRCPDSNINPTPVEPGVWAVAYVRKRSTPIIPYMMCKVVENKVICEASPTSSDVKVEYNWTFSGHVLPSADTDGRIITVGCLAGNGTGTINLTVSSPYAASDGIAQTPVTCTAPIEATERLR